MWGMTRDFPYNSEKNPYFGFRTRGLPGQRQLDAQSEILRGGGITAARE